MMRLIVWGPKLDEKVSELYKGFDFALSSAKQSHLCCVLKID